MNLTHEDYQKAKRISEAIQEFLFQTGMKDARSTDVYDFLARKGLVEKDRHQGLHFRKFLLKLKDANILSQLIPQCTYTTNEWGKGEWRFHLSTKKASSVRNSGQAVAAVHKPAMSKEEILQLLQEESANVETLPLRTDKIYTPQELSIKKNYPRAYEYWTEREYKIFVSVYTQCRNLDVVAGLLKRQPHIVKEKLEAKGLDKFA
jgi:hypothetical protein